MILPASYANGFAPRDGQPLYPELQRGCVSNLSPSLGPTGLTLRDWSPLKAHGTLVNGASVKPVAGSYAADLDGTNDHVLVTPSPAVLAALNGNQFAVSMWVYVRSFTNQPVVWVIQQNGSLDSGLIEFNATGTQLFVRTGNNTSGATGLRTYTLSATVAVNTWTHICFVKTGTGDNGILYVNGVQQTSYTGTLTTCVVTSAYFIYYGIYTTAVPLNGALDGMLIHDRPISASLVNVLKTRRGIVNELDPRRRVSSAVQFNRRRRLLLGAS